MSVVIGVLALQGDVREHANALEQCGATAIGVRRAEELDRVDGLVIPGGESTAMWKLMRAFDLLKPLRKRIEAGLPAYGSCAGMIMLADRIVDGAAGQETIGGIDMTVRRNAFGRQVDSYESTISFAGQSLEAVFIRAPWVESVGDGVEVLGQVELPGRPEEGSRDDGPRHRIVAVRQGRLMATAYHPELTGDPIVHRYFTELVRQSRNNEE
ncbi:pyridoxal 5'-phosphate synthase glutaminase subunit PdxT [Actinocorallia sp. A-T 12471]|uniref:pyridoxal 5'-phosphate synthase glutaminase subunit PdxT n=1 Tax=Actinocorallia sp. A-T 12471 TaxID=3089813 RepID=UPI0029D01D7B|nr:pyridoxal 5'-phosphate synthase glutaminase subunit PdxT [Actinocorallia sp. A-T 12471]MDX6740311.1 pyridoxal 5'-phosphate synthase glutaminase subunit PdxT [Actinocorallia sp. A-T 12471]